jgi:F-type H+-transporting ATPase subunit epsilon
MPTFNMAIYTPEGEVFNGSVESLDAPGRDGRFGVLAHHAPMIIALRRGIVKANGDGKTAFFVTGEGVLEISDGNVTILADTAVTAEDQGKATALLAS